MATHYTILTDIGAAKIANAYRLGTQLSVTSMAIGDGGGTLPTPNSSDTKLVNEKYRAQINLSYIDETNTAWVVFEQVLPPDIGGWWIREVALYDDDGDLVAIGNYPEQYKPLLAEGASTTQTVRVVIQVLSSSAITLKVDPSVVLATRQYVDDSVAKHAASNDHPLATESKKGMLQLATASETKTGTNGTKATHPAGVKTAVDAAVTAHANASTAHKASQIALDAALSVFGSAVTTVQGVLAALGSASKIDVATQAEVDAGTVEKAVTAKTLKSWVKQATESVLGLVKVATQAQVDAGADDTAAVTPKKLRWGISYNLGSNGYVALPSWLGGIIFQWVVVSITDGIGSNSWPVAFPNSVFRVISSESTSQAWSGTQLTVTGPDMQLTTTSTVYARSFRWNGSNFAGASNSGTVCLGIGR